jgi:hypothetical protein
MVVERGAERAAAVVVEARAGALVAEMGAAARVGVVMKVEREAEMEAVETAEAVTAVALAVASVVAAGGWRSAEGEASRRWPKSVSDRWSRTRPCWSSPSFLIGHHCTYFLIGHHCTYECRTGAEAAAKA